jgi:integrase
MKIRMDRKKGPPKSPPKIYLLFNNLALPPPVVPTADFYKDPLRIIKTIFMLSISFYLREPQAERETPIIMMLVLQGEKMKYSTEERIHPQHWDAVRQRAKMSKSNAHGLELNVYLEKLYTLAVTAYRELLNTDDGMQPSLQDIKVSMDRRLNRMTGAKMDFFGFFQKLIAQSQSGVRLNPQSGRPITVNTIKSYSTTLRHLREFCTARRKKIDFKDINLAFYGEYTEYLMMTAKLSINTIGKHIQIIKLIMNESLVGCYTGLRYSDYSVLKPENIRDGLIEITQVKTNDPVVIPLHDAVLRIMARYGGQLPKSFSNQKTNHYLKDLGELTPCLSKEVTRSFTKEGKRQQVRYAKWELLTTHTARRSLATNEYLGGTPTLTIMAITGHKTEKAFLRYIKLVSSDHAKLLKAHWERRKLESKITVET